MSLSMRKGTKQSLVLCFVLAFCYTITSAQNYNNPGGTITDCNGTFLDSGGAGSDYGNNEDITTTICPDVAGECVTVDFTQFNVENNFDFLYINQGLTTGTGSAMSYTGTNSPGTVSSTHPSGCLTFIFTSDGSATDPGWTGSISCSPCPAPPPCTGTTPTCTNNPPDICSDACDLGALNMPSGCPGGGSVTNSFCLSNVGANVEIPYTFLTNCEDGNDMSNPAADVWYSFVATSNEMEIEILGLNNPSVGVYQGSDCSTMIGRGCDNGIGYLSLMIDPVTAGETYYLQISGGDPTDVGDFTLNITSIQDCTDCLLSNNLTATPAPMNGTYLPGQTVEFCYTVNEWNQTALNWIHAVQPLPGAGWDISTLTPTVTPPSCDGSGAWLWLNSITGSVTGNTIGPAWGYDSSQGAPLPFTDGDPGNNYGDDCQGPGNTWTFCWQITTDNCPPNDTGDDLSMTVETFGDYETGSWTDVGCQNDPVTIAFASISCCPQPLVTIDANPPCSSSCTGAATVTGQGSGPYNFIWEDASGNVIQNNMNQPTSDQATGLCPGTYSITVTDTNDNCSVVTTATITSGASPSVSISPTNPLICGMGTEDLTATGSGGTGMGYTYVWEFPDASTSNTPTITANQNGTYTVILTDSGGCTASAQTTVTISDPVTSITASNTTIDCNNSNATLDAGTGFTSYNWSTTESTQAIVVSAAGTYTVTVTDAAGCTATDNITITSVAIPSVSINPNNPSICNGNSVDLTATGSSGTGMGYTYTWEFPDASTSTGATVSANQTGNYTVTVTDSGGCTATAQTTVTISNISTNISASNTVLNCMMNSATLDAGAGFDNYVWSNGDGTQVTTVTNAGTYTVTVTDTNGCTATDDITITADANSVSVWVGVDRNYCAGHTVQLGALATGGDNTYSYNWSNGVNTEEQLVTPAMTTTYTVTVTDGTGCTATDELVVNIMNNNPPVINDCPSDISVSNDPGQCDAVVTWTEPTVTDDCPPPSISDMGYTFNYAGMYNGHYYYISDIEWTPGNVVNGDQVQTFATAQSIANTYNGYIATIDDQGENDYIQSLGLYYGNMLIGLTDEQVEGNFGWIGTCCNGGGSGFLNWNGGEPNNAGDEDYVELFVGTGLWNDIDIDLSQRFVVIELPDVPVELVCGNDSGDVFPVGTTTVSCSATDWAGNTATCSFDITVNDTEAPSVNCMDITLSVDSGPITIVPSDVFDSGNDNCGTVNLISVSPNTFDCSDLGMNTVTLTVDDGNGNSNTCTATVTITTSLDVSIMPASPSFCTGSSVDITATGNGGGGTYTYEWTSPSGNTLAGGTVMATEGGIYEVTVTDNNGCTASQSVTVVEHPLPVAPSIIPSAPELNCSVMNITLDAGTGYDSYEWSTGDMTQTTDISNPGDYTVTVSNANGCTITSNINITQALEFSTDIIGDLNICQGESTMLDATTTNATSYIWSNGEMTPMIDVDMAGTYTVTVTDGMCNGTASVTVIMSMNPTPMIMGDAVVCGNDLTTLDAGSGFDSYSWSDGSNTSTISVGAGTYTVTVTNADGCTGTDEFEVNTNPDPIYNVIDDIAICEGYAMTLGTVTAQGTTYSWTSSPNDPSLTNPNIGTPNVSPTVTTTYTLTATNGICSETASVTITIEDANLIATGGTICEGESAVLSAVGSPVGGTYTWTDWQGNNIGMGENIQVNPFGDASYLVTYSVGNCSESMVVEVDVLSNPGIDISTSQPNIVVGESTTLVVENAPTGSTFVWTSSNGDQPNGAESVDVNPTVETTYTVEVTTPEGCVYYASITVGVSNLDFDIPNIFTPNGDDLNDRFYIVNANLNLDIIEFKVFDRWGQVIHDNPGTPWDGTFNGKEMPSDIYVYIFRIQNADGSEELMKGDVALMR